MTVESNTVSSQSAQDEKPGEATPEPQAKPEATKAEVAKPEALKTETASKNGKNGLSSTAIQSVGVLCKHGVQNVQNV